MVSRNLRQAHLLEPDSERAKAFKEINHPFESFE